MQRDAFRSSTCGTIIGRARARLSCYNTCLRVPGTVCKLSYGHQHRGDTHCFSHTVAMIISILHSYFSIPHFPFLVLPVPPSAPDALLHS